MAVVTAAGIDTWSPCWWLEPSSAAARHLAALCRGGVLPDAIAGHRVGLRGGLLWAEGHPAEGLGLAADLAGALARLELALLEAGVPLPVGRRGGDLYGDQHEGFAGIRRLDSTVDLAVDSTAEGLAIMFGVAAVATTMARAQANVWWAPSGQRRVETVAIHGYSGGRLLGRVYDKGAESGTAAPGRLLRPEDQRRWDKGSRRGVDELTGQYVRSKFVSRFAPLWRASKGVTVAGPIALAGRLRDLVEGDELTAAQAETLAGHLLMSSVGLPGQSGSTRKRRRRALREYGLVLADGVLQEVEVDLGDVLAEALETDAWERRG